MATENAPTAPFLTAATLLEHWQGHRRLTRRMIEVFPEDQLNTFSLGGMRPFGLLALELLDMAAPMLRGIVTGEWSTEWSEDPLPRAEVLRRWDESTVEIDALWPEIAPERYGETITSFGQYTSRVDRQVLYMIDNEIHHRGQGYVYLRALGIEPPPFWERS